MNKLGFHNQLNFRDLGGYETADGRHIKERMLYRSGGLYLLTEEERKRFDELNINFILDLRSKSEVERKPDPTFDGIRILQHSGLEHKSGKEIDFSPAGMARTGGEGKDRTGVAAMLVLYLLGVTPDTILEDYLLSNEFLKDDVAVELKERADIVARDPVAKTLSIMKCGVTEEAGRTALNTILNAHPDAVTFFAKEYDIPADTLASVRDFYLE